MSHSELTSHLEEVLRDLQIRLVQAKTYYEELLHQHNAIHSTISALAEPPSKQN